MKKKKEDYQFIGIIALFALACIVSWQLSLKDHTRQQNDSVDIHAFPREIGSWTSEEMPITDDEYAILETRNAFVRKYTNPDGQDVYLFMVYSESNRRVSHPPEICFVGGGVSVLEKSKNIIPLPAQNVLLEVNQLLLEKGPVQHMAFYWYKVGNLFTPSYSKQQVLYAIRSLFGKSTSSALIRVSNDVIDGDLSAAIANLKDFTSLAASYITKHLP